MNIRIVDYKCECANYIFTKNKERLSELISVNKKVLYYEQNYIELYPRATKVLLSDEQSFKFSCIGDDSILQINDGNVFVYFDTNMNDNALFITNQCNSNCRMCPVSEKQRKHSLIETIDNLLEICSYIPNYRHHITITGGEPFLLKDDIFLLFRYLKLNLYSVDFLLLTNGRAFANKKYLNSFIDTAPNNLTLGIPIHGHNSDLHDYITRTPGSFNQTTKGIKSLLAAKCKIELRIVVSKINVEYLDEIAEYIINELRGVSVIKFIGLEMLGTARKNMDDVWIDYLESFKYMKSSILKLIKKGFDVGIYNYPLCCVDKSYWPICERSISAYKIRYLEACEKCSVKDICGGMFQGTYRLMDGIIRAIV